MKKTGGRKSRWTVPKGKTPLDFAKVLAISNMYAYIQYATTSCCKATDNDYFCYNIMPLCCVLYGTVYILLCVYSIWSDTAEQFSFITAMFVLCPSVYNTVHNVQCTVYRVQCTVYIVLCPVYCVQCTLYSVQCTVNNVHCTVSSVLCTMYIVLCPVYCVQWTLYCVQCTEHILRTHLLRFSVLTIQKLLSKKTVIGTLQN